MADQYDRLRNIGILASDETIYLAPYTNADYEDYLRLRFDIDPEGTRIARRYWGAGERDREVLLNDPGITCLIRLQGSNELVG